MKFSRYLLRFFFCSFFFTQQNQRYIEKKLPNNLNLLETKRFWEKLSRNKGNIFVLF